MPRRRDRVERGDPPRRLLSFAVWVAEQGHSTDPEQAEEAWEWARTEWIRSASSLDEISALYGPGFDPPASPDPRAPEHEGRD